MLALFSQSKGRHLISLLYYPEEGFGKDLFPETLKNWLDCMNFYYYYEVHCLSVAPVTDDFDNTLADLSF